jgi:hypothetical protein
MIDVLTIRISKAQFETLPQEERTAIFVAGHIMNQVGIFMKLVRFSISRDPTSPVESHTSGMQTQILLRTLMAALAEASVWMEERQALIDKYLPDMPQEGRDAYGKVKDHSDPKGLIMRIRNNFLYHYPNEKNVEKAFKAVPDSEPWEWYFSSANTNTMYFSCELVVGYGLWVNEHYRGTHAFRRLRSGNGKGQRTYQFHARFSYASDRGNCNAQFRRRCLEATGQNINNRGSDFRRVLASFFRISGEVYAAEQ